MARKEHLHRLFDAQTKDFNDLLHEPDEVVLCPICLRDFPREAIDQELINDGHVWPEDIRKLSEKAGHMQVLMCKDCNEDASLADKQMQTLENIKQGEQNGDFYGVRLVELHEEGNEKPIKVRVNVRRNKNGSYTVTGRLGKDRRIKDSSPEDQARFENMRKEKKKVSLTIHPPHGYIPELVQHAWITSAYLMAFYALGYRYIMVSNTQPVRDYILSSFELKGEKLPIPNEENFTLLQYADEYHPDPEIAFIYPLEKGKRVYILVSFLSYAVKLPFLYETTTMNTIMDSLKARMGEDFDRLTSEGLPLQFNIPCTKTKIHECMFDFIMGKDIKISPTV